MAGLQGDPWKISAEERAKHDAQFFSLKPVGGFVTGDQARGFFIQSGLPMPILGHIWGLADMNADGKMDKKEFSIAMHLIAKKLQGIEPPRALPTSLKVDPMPAGGMGMSAGFGTLPYNSPTPSLPPPPMYNTLPSMGRQHTDRIPPLHMSPASGSFGMNVAPVQQGVSPVAPQGSDWAIPANQRMRYNQVFASEDRARKGHLNGMEAKGVLSRFGLPTNVLAQIWGLSDLDSDGKLTQDEFCVCMFLVDMVKAGQPIPAKLPPDFIPPSYRRGAPAGFAPQPQMQPKDALGDLLSSGISMGVPPPVVPVEINLEPDILASQTTFEDKRKENFDKGQAELERRRAMLQEDQKRMEQERLAKERAEHEKREQKRMEQERKKQMEMEKQMAKQMQLEQEREDARRKALEQREAARRELERQRQMEWERQRRDQLMAEKIREHAQVDRLKSEVGTHKHELEAQDNKKVELQAKIEQSRHTVTDLTSTIDSMRVSRDIKLADIEKMQQDVQTWQTKLGGIQYERQQLDIKVQAQNESMDDSYKTVMHSFNSKKERVETLRSQLQELEAQAESKQKEIDQSGEHLNEINNKLNDLQTSTNLLQDQMSSKMFEWQDIKQAKEEENKPAEKVNGFSSSWSFDTPAVSSKSSVVNSSSEHTLQDAWASFSMTTTTSTTNSTANNAKGKDAWSSAFDSFDVFSKPSDVSSTTPTSQTKAASPPQADTWGQSFDSNTSSTAAPAKTDSAFGGASAWANLGGSTDNAVTTATPTDSGKLYCAMFQFDARNPDELTLQPGDIVKVSGDQSGAEPGWMCGECDGRTGYFPEAYVQAHDGSADTGAVMSPQQDVQSPVLANDFSVEDIEKSSFADPAAVSAFAATDQQNVNNLQSAESSFTAVSSIPTGSPTPGQGHSAPDGLQAQALYPWKAKKENHLTFNKGDVILIKEQQDMWWSGQLDGQVGWFPKSYVKLVGASTAVTKVDESPAEAPSPPQFDITSPQEPTQSPSSPFNTDAFGGEKHVALFGYQSAESGDLSFNQGDIVMVTKNDGDWWTGIAGDRTGIFPANYVKKIIEESPEKELEPSSQKMSTVKKPEIASVIAPYQATGPEQLSLTPGQLILVRKKSPSGWWEGELQARGQKRKVGWFPANYVSLRGSSSSRNTPDGQRTSPSKSLSPTPQPMDQGSRSVTPISYPQPTTAPALEQVVALYNYAAQNADELSFNKGSVINVVSKSDPDWWKGELNGQTGVFPSNYVSPLSEVGQEAESSAYLLSPGSERLQKRQNAINELIDTEEAYMSDLLLVRDVFYKPFNAEKVIDEVEKQTIFVNWKDLVKCNTKLLKALRVRKKMSKGNNIHMVGDILCENIPHMTPYIRFCSCQLNAASLIQKKTENDKKFADVHKRCWMDTRTKGMPLSSFLLKPMQRVTKYPLLIEKILNCTDEIHHDYSTLQAALSKAQELCSQVNEGVREKENSDRLEWIQNHVFCEGLPEKISFNTVTNCLGPRKYLHSGSLFKAKSGKELVGFLFNDFLLLTQPQKSVGNLNTVFSLDVKHDVTFKMYRNPIFLNEIMLKQSSASDAPENNAIFHLHHIERVYSLRAISPTVKERWVKTIETASKLYLDTERKKREKAHSARMTLSKGCGRLMVIVTEGDKLTPSDVTGKSDPYCEVSMGAQEHKTKVINNTLNPKWNSSMQFTIKDLREDVLCLTVYDRDLFTPNDFLGRTEIRVEDILLETQASKGPVSKKLPLYEVESGEVHVKLDLQLFHN